MPKKKVSKKNKSAEKENNFSEIGLINKFLETATDIGQIVDGQNSKIVRHIIDSIQSRMNDVKGVDGKLEFVWRHKKHFQQLKATPFISPPIKENDREKFGFMPSVNDQILEWLKFEEDYLTSLKNNLTKNFVVSEKQVERQTEKTVNDFFDEVKEGIITNIEIYNKVQKLTDNFDLIKLKLLYDDFEFYLFLEQEYKLAAFSKEDIAKAIEELQKNNRPIPYREIPDFVKTEKGIKVIMDGFKVVDDEKLLYPFYFFTCYQFRNLLETEIEKRGDNIKHKETFRKTQETFDNLPHATFILKMLEDLSVTVNGKPELGERKKSALRGIVEASIEQGILPNQNIHSLCQLIGAKIGLPIKAKLAESFTSKEMKKTALRYISENFSS